MGLWQTGPVKAAFGRSGPVVSLWLASLGLNLHEPTGTNLCNDICTIVSLFGRHIAGNTVELVSCSVPCSFY